MPKKSKPRTNWKQRALHCEEVIGVQNTLAELSQKRVDSFSRGMKYWQDRAEDFRKNLCETIKRAEAAERQTLAAEKQNDLLLEERKCARRATLANLMPPQSPTHWQRFKSWLSRRGKQCG